MKKLLGPLLVALLIMMLVALVGGSASVAEGAEGGDDAKDKGKDAFLALKCNTCHSVPSAGIEAKAPSAALQGPDLPVAIDAERDAVIKYLRKEAELHGITHKKAIKGTDEELNATLDWLATLPVIERD